MSGVEKMVRRMAERRWDQQWSRGRYRGAEKNENNWRHREPKPLVYGYTHLVASQLAGLLNAAGAGVNAKNGEFAVDGVLVTLDVARLRLRERAHLLIEELPQDVEWLGNGIRHSVVFLQDWDKYANAVVRAMPAGDVDWTAKPKEDPAVVELRRQLRFIERDIERGENFYEQTVDGLSGYFGDFVTRAAVSEVSEELGDGAEKLIADRRGDGSATVEGMLIAGGAKRGRKVFTEPDGSKVRVRGLHLPEELDEDKSIVHLLTGRARFVAKNYSVEFDLFMSEVAKVYDVA